MYVYKTKKTIFSRVKRYYKCECGDKWTTIEEKERKLPDVDLKQRGGVEKDL